MTTNKIAADAVVLAEDVAEEFTEQAAEVVTIVKNNPILLAGVAFTALGIGGFAGYKFAERKLTTKYDKMLDKEIAETEAFFTGRNSARFPTEKPADELDEELEEVEKAIVRNIRQYNRAPSRPDTVLQVPEIIEEVVIQESDSEDPVLISFEDYNNSGPEAQQLTITYYAEDDILADEADNVIENVEATVGIDNLDFIRHSDKLTFYIRNRGSALEFEVDKVQRSYSETVHGDLNS